MGAQTGTHPLEERIIFSRRGGPQANKNKEQVLYLEERANDHLLSVPFPANVVNADDQRNRQHNFLSLKR